MPLDATQLRPLPSELVAKKSLVVHPSPEAIDYYYDRPEEFAYDQIISHRRDRRGLQLAEEQTSLLRAIARYPRVTVVSGHGTGKTASLAFTIMWFLCTRPKAIVVVTGPKADQLRDTIWTEINRWLVYSPLRHMLTWSAEKITVKQKGKSTADWYAVARTASEPQNMAGFHDEHLMFIVDEAAGVKDPIFEVIEGALTQEDNKLVLCSQGIATRGYFFDSHNKDKEDWFCLRFNSEISRLANPAYAARIARKFGKDSDVYRVRVLGLFPRGNAEAFIQLEDVLLAASRYVSEDKLLEKFKANKSGKPIGSNVSFSLGVDVSRGGADLSVICCKWGNKIFPLITYPGSLRDLVRLSEHVIDAVKQFRTITEYKGPVRVKIDDTGVGGGVTDILLRDKDNLLVVVPVNFSSGVDDEVDSEFYDNQVSLMWGEFRDQLPYLQLPEDELLHEELSTRRTVPGRGGRIRIEPKERFKKEYGASPDRADATILACSTSSEKKRVWPGFSRYNETVCRDYKINWRQMEAHGAKIMVAIHQEKNLNTSLIASLWDAKDGKLYIFEEVVSPAPRPELVLPAFKGKLDKITKDPSLSQENRFSLDMRRFQWYGNNEMFGLSEKATNFKSARDGTANSFIEASFGVSIMPNLYFDEAGAIAQAGRLFAAQRILVHSRCKSMIRDIESWRVAKGQVETGSGLCLALCNLTNLLFKTGKVNFQKHKIKPYSQMKQAIREELEKASNEGRLSEYVQRGY